jgi:hypothetical protein
MHLSKSAKALINDMRTKHSRQHQPCAHWLMTAGELAAREEVLRKKRNQRRNLHRKQAKQAAAAKRSLGCKRKPPNSAKQVRSPERQRELLKRMLGGKK